MRAPALMLLVIATTGCSMGGMRWSGPATAGHGRIGIVPEARHETGGSLVPDLSVEYRRGVTDRLDLGGRVFAVGGALDGRYALARSEDVEASLGAGLRGSLSPAYVPGSYDRDGYELAFDPTLRIGVNVSRKSQIAMGLTPSLEFVREHLGAFEKHGLTFSPTATLAFDVGVSDGFHVVPEVSASTFVGSHSFLTTDDSLRLRAALGFYF